LQKGKLIRQTTTGRMATVVRDPYTHRFMEAEDYEMESHGMGEYAGVYAGAVDIVWMDSGVKQRIKQRQYGFEVIG